MKKEIDPDALMELMMADEDPTEEVFNLGLIKRILAKWWLILLLALLGLAAGLYLQSTRSPSFQAVSMIEINQKVVRLMGEDLERDLLRMEMQMETMVTRMSGPMMRLKAAQHPEIQALKEVIPPPASLKPIYMRTPAELQFEPAASVAAARLATMLESWVEVRQRKDTALIEITVRHPKPETARVIADTYAQAYVNFMAETKANENTEARAILAKEVESAREQLRSVETSLQVYARAIELRQDVQESRAELVKLRQRYKLLHPRRIEAEGVHEDLLDRFAREINRAVEVGSEQDYWNEFKPRLQALEHARRQPGREGLVAADEWLALAQSSLTARAAFLSTTMEQQKEVFQGAKQRISELGMAQQDTFDDVSVVEEAYVLPASTLDRVKLLLAGLVLGGGAGGGLAFLLAVLDYKIHDVITAEEITGLTCLAAIMQDKTFCIPVTTPWTSVLLNEKNSANCEAVRTLRTSIMLLGKQERHQSILFTSAGPAEGKTMISMETAAAFALSKEKTVLLDLDLRKPMVARGFPKLDKHIGIADVLSGQCGLEDAIQSTDVENLDVILSGAKVANPAELLHEKELAKLMETLRQRYDRIIVDAAPVLPVSDTRILSKQVDNVILIALAHKTPGGAMIRAKQLLTQGGGKVVGVVVNGLTARARGYGYYGYKGYGEYGANAYGESDEA